MALYYNKKIANEIKQSQQNYIKSSPYYKRDDFVSMQDKRFANRRSIDGHPFPSGNERSYFTEPLVVSSKHYKNFEDYNNRSDYKDNFKPRGGSMLYNKPVLGGGYSSSSSDSSSDSDYSSDEEEGAGIYEDVILPVGRTIGYVGKEILKDVVLPIGKEILKKKIRGALGGGQKKKINNKDFDNLLKKSNKCSETVDASSNGTNDASSNGTNDDISNILKSSKIHSKKNSIVPIVGTKKGESVRGLIVKKIMKERGVNLGQASKIVKEEKLY